jgi:hypothetical protein
MIFDATVKLGDIITAASILAGGLVVLATMRADLAGLNRRLDVVEVELKRQTEILIALARVDERLIALERRIDAEHEAGRG